MIETRIMQKGDVFKLEYRYTQFLKKWFYGWMEFQDKSKLPTVSRRGLIYPVKFFNDLSDARKAEKELKSKMIPENTEWRQVGSNYRARPKDLKS